MIKIIIIIIILPTKIRLPNVYKCYPFIQKHSYLDILYNTSNSQQKKKKKKKTLTIKYWLNNTKLDYLHILFRSNDTKTVSEKGMNTWLLLTSKSRGESERSFSALVDSKRREEKLGSGFVKFGPKEEYEQQLWLILIMPRKPILKT